MPQVTLVPWITEEVMEFATPWSYAGTPSFAGRAPSDGNHAACTINLGENDSNSLRGKQWRVDGTGAVFNWANRTITNIKFEVAITNLTASGMNSWAIMFANETLTYVEQPFNGDFFSPYGVLVWHTFLNALHPQVRDAILADNFLSGYVFYNHDKDFSTVTYEASRLVIDYNDDIKSAIQASEI